MAGLDGFATMPPPPDGPLQSATTRPRQRRDPYSMDEMGRLPWDRFQTLCGIQYYFDTEFQLLRGHLLLTSTEWALSSINQSGLWETQRVLDPDGHISVLSVDIGDFNTPSRSLVDEFGRGKAARDCTADEIATEVWRQIVFALTSDAGSAEEDVMPEPVWYALDRSLIMADGPGQGRGRVVRNESPYLVPIVGDWDNRPGTEPWNPHGTSLIDTPSEDVWLDDLEQWNVWQARHGGYQVHNNSVVFAGTWNKTFTRVTSMESACESGRHAVNAILDHYIWVESGGVDRRKKSSPLDWKFPYGFLDQGLSSPIRMPTPAGDYCYIFDIENREPADTRPLRVLDELMCRASIPRPPDVLAVPHTPLLTGGQQMFAPTTDPNWLLAYLQTWQQLLQQWMALAAGLSAPNAPSGISPMPHMPFTPPMPPSGPMPGSPTQPSPTIPPAPSDYTQQLFGYLQAWRQQLEQVTGGQPGVAQPAISQPAGAPQGVPTYANNSQTHPVRPPNVITPPPDPGGSKGTLGAAEVTREGATSPWPPTYEAVRSLFGSMVPAEVALSPTNPIGAWQQRPNALKSPSNPYGSQISDLNKNELADLERQIATSFRFREKKERDTREVPVRPAPRPLYAPRAARTTAPEIRDPSQRPSP